eukprot:CFRG6538T1
MDTHDHDCRNGRSHTGNMSNAPHNFGLKLKFDDKIPDVVAELTTNQGELISSEGKLSFFGPDGENVSSSLSDLEIINELDRGRFATVYRVRHAATQTIMAVKRILLDENERNLVLREIDILFRCRSPYVVSYYGVFFEDGDISICMEYMDCGSWDSIYKQTLSGSPTKIPEWILQCISVSVLNGLVYLKNQRIIHRDIKPSNILLNTKGDIKLCDFNVSGNLKGSMAATYVGTARYMAPERIGRNSNYDVRVDVWSLGLVLVELGTAIVPFTAVLNESGHVKTTKDYSSTPFVLLGKIKNGDPPSLCEQQGFSLSMRDFVYQCLRKDPLERPKPTQLMKHKFIDQAPDCVERLRAWIAEHKLGEKGLNL